jgi:UDP-galactopyranose mutase
MTEHTEIAIIGAGLAGLSAAYHLGAGYTLFELEDEIGGHTRSRRTKGFIFDEGIHVLHTQDPLIIDLMSSLGVEFVTRRREAWLHYRGFLTRYPIQANTFGLPVDVVKDCLLGAIHAYYEPSDRPPTNYAEWLVAAFGKGVSEHFLLPYAEKFWTLPASELNLAWMDARIPRPSLDEIVAGALSDQTKGFGPNALFRYPIASGIDALPKAFARQLQGKILTGKSLKGVNPLKKLLTFADGSSYTYDQLIFTMPLPVFATVVEGLPDKLRQVADQLRHTSILCVNVGVEREAITDKHWIYYPEDDFIFARISFPMNFAPGLIPPGYSSISAEIVYSDWRPLDAAFASQQVIPDLRKAGILQPQDNAWIVDVENIEYAYVIYDHQWDAATKILKTHLRSMGLILAGVSENGLTCGCMMSFRAEKVPQKT